MPPRRALLAAILALSMLFAVVGSAWATVDAVIRSSGTTWDPTRTVVHAGDTVKWKATSLTHTVSAYGGGWSKNVTLSTGETTRKTFNSTGTYKFRCMFHSTLTSGVCSGMCGKVVVRA